MEEDETVEAFLSIIALSMLFIFMILGLLIESSNPDSYSSIDFNPKEDLYYITVLCLVNLFFLFIFLLKTLSFRRSYNLNKRYVELLKISDKMIFYCVLFFPIQGFMIYFYIKYFKTGFFAVFLFLVILFEIGFIILVFFNYYRIQMERKEELAEK